MLRLVGILICLLLRSPAEAEPAQWIGEGWRVTDFSKTSVKWTEISSGGPAMDGIPSIDRPTFADAATVAELTARDPVIGLEVAGDARAYPLRILIWHEIVNDTVGGLPVTVTYCPLCNSAVVFDRRVGGRTLEFGTTGKLRHSDLVMYDRQTETWWQQFTGEALVGALLGSTLRLVPTRLESFADFRARHPGGKVLVPAPGTARPYGRNPYVDYDTQAGPFLFKGELPKGIEAMARVVVVRREGAKPLIVAMETIRNRGRLDLEGLQISWRLGQVSAVDAAKIAASRDVGTVDVRSVSADKTGDMVPYDVIFAFVANAFHPDVSIVKD